MEKSLELEISKNFMDSTVNEFNERISDNMVGRLSRQLNEIKIKRDREIAKSVSEIMEKYESDIRRINMKILTKAKLLGKK